MRASRDWRSCWTGQFFRPPLVEKKKKSTVSENFGNPDSCNAKQFFIAGVEVELNIDVA
jgi:hypothetical protein